MYVYVYECVSVPDPVNPIKIVKGQPFRCALGSWYLAGTEHLHPTI